MHSNVNLFAKQSLFQFFREKPFSDQRTRLAEADIHPLVAGGLDYPDLNIQLFMEPLQCLFDQFGLRKSQLTTTSPENNFHHVRGHSIAAVETIDSRDRFNHSSKSDTCFEIRL